jgi:hypothetical protein
MVATDASNHIHHFFPFTVLFFSLPFFSFPLLHKLTHLSQAHGRVSTGFRFLQFSYSRLDCDGGSGVGGPVAPATVFTQELQCKVSHPVSSSWFCHKMSSRTWCAGWFPFSSLFSGGRYHSGVNNSDLLGAFSLCCSLVFLKFNLTRLVSWGAWCSKDSMLGHPRWSRPLQDVPHLGCAPESFHHGFRLKTHF